MIKFSRANYALYAKNAKLFKHNVRAVSQLSNNGHDHEENSKFNFTLARNLLIGATVSSWLLYEANERRKNSVHLASQVNNVFGAFKPGLPQYTLDEVAKHKSLETKVWCTYKEGVYDVTKYIPYHPGGDQIMMAAGSSLDPFWAIYAAHNTEHVLYGLESMRIGNLAPQDASQVQHDIDNPYASDPPRHAAMIATSATPYCGEPPLSVLVQKFHTPNELFYVRNHLPVPPIDLKSYEIGVEIEGQARKCFSLSLEDLKKFPQHKIAVSTMCSGNKRNMLSKVKNIQGLNWGNGAIGTATWTGIKLRDVLLAAGIDENSKYKHVQFEGLDIDATGVPYGGSIALSKALNPYSDILIAYEMNGGPLPPDHGYPVRILIPGVAGARSVKWLSKIVVSNEESPSFWQQQDYKGFSPSTDWNNVDYKSAPAIQDLPVYSTVCIPAAGDTVQVKDGYINVQGYAWSGGGNKIVRVDLTIDGGKLWHDAKFDQQDTAEPGRHWTWTLWSARIPVPKGTTEVEVWARAVDSCYNSQPEEPKHIWNLRGVASNAWDKVPIKLQWK